MKLQELEPAPPPAAASGAPAAARRVLVVDDDPAILYLILKVLGTEPLRFAPLGVASAEEALAVLASTAVVDCLLADVLLPGMDGIQLLVSARALRPELKIVVMTASPSDDLLRAVLDSGASRLLAKPLDFEELLASVAADRPGTLASLTGCELATTAAGVLPFREGGKGGKGGHSLRGLTLRHLIEWAIRERETCTMTVLSRRRTGHLSFADGRIREAGTAEHSGGQAAAEILGWSDLRVEVIRAPADGGFADRLERFGAEIEGFLATSVCRRRDGSAVGSRSADPDLDVAAAAGGYAAVLAAHQAALAAAGAPWGDTEDLLITTANAYLLIRLLGEGHYHWLAVSSDASLALCRYLMRSWEGSLRAGLKEFGEPAA